MVKAVSATRPRASWLRSLEEATPIFLPTTARTLSIAFRSATF